MDPTGVAASFPPNTAIHALADDDLPQLWSGALAALEAESPSKPILLPPIFLSHAVEDEAEVLPLVQHLRKHAGASVFLCADSIQPGTQWSPSIERELRGCGIFFMVISKASLQSQYCAFEVGMAVALEKPLALLSLDGSPPPAFVQNLQVMDVDRLNRRKPWLLPTEARIECALLALGHLQTMVGQ
jgi:hypothetical protein